MLWPLQCKLIDISLFHLVFKVLFGQSAILSKTLGENKKTGLARARKALIGFGHQRQDTNERKKGLDV